MKVSISFPWICMVQRYGSLTLVPSAGEKKPHPLSLSWGEGGLEDWSGGATAFQKIDQTVFSPEEMEDVNIDLQINLEVAREIDACLYKSRRGLILMTMDALHGGTAQQKKNAKKRLIAEL